MFNQWSDKQYMLEPARQYRVIQNYVIWHLLVDARLLLSVLYGQPVSNHVKQ